MRPPLALATAATAAGIAYAAIRGRRELRSRERLAAASLEALLNAIDANDRTTGAHVRRVATYALLLGRGAGLEERQCHSVERVALFHDIGKIDAALFDIVHEGAQLGERARRLIASHPQRGADVLRPLAPFYPDLADGVLAHHERWNGSGYPRGLRGTDIPLAARIVAIADTFDAITHQRPYRERRSAATAARVLRDGRGTEFDPALVDIFLAPPVWPRVQRALRDAHRPRRRGGRRRRQAPPETPPDVTFRWRSGAAEPTTPDPAPRTPP
jgi:putative two-component system response regulator